MRRLAAVVATVVAVVTLAACDPAPATWDKVAKCESNGNWSAIDNTSRGGPYYGGLQITLTRWRAAGGGAGVPSQYPRTEQIRVANVMWNQDGGDPQGWRYWFGCAHALGLI